MLRSTDPLVLSFDMLSLSYKPYGAYLLLCDANWKPLNLPSSRFVEGINRYPINDFSYQSQATIPYIHYRFEIPQVLRAGNYLVVVHGLADPQDLLLSKRFMVYDGTIGIEASAVAALKREDYDRKHRIVLQLNQSKRPAANPGTDFIVQIRQNKNWRSTRVMGQPMIRNRSELIYSPPFGGSDFCALPSFRRFDTRSFFNGNAVGIYRWAQNDRGVYGAYLEMDRSRASIPHVPLQDINGSYFTESTDHGVVEYIEVHFRLSVDEPLRTPVYVLGEFNQWRQQPEAKMRYDSLSKEYRCRLKLKQGYYEYLYWTEEKGFEEMEGCWSQSENEYEVMVYYRARTRGEEPLVGYLLFKGQI